MFTLLASTLLSCLLSMPVEGPVVVGYAPSGSYGGHWGIDIAVPEGTVVRSAGPGSVTFAGSVAGRLSVTVHHGGGVRTSVSYLSSVNVGAGQKVGRSALLGWSGLDHDRPAVHFSLRVGDRYLDPMAACRVGAPGAGVRLVGGAIGISPYSS
jgi:murein DD-endopeptidase MepM/ murein hydrolase activator NlpD